MTDIVDLAQAQNEGIVEKQLATRVKPALSAEDVERIVRQGRECVDCGEPIAPQRLRAVPFATRCIECQEEWEQIR